ncbi:dienelactone hydrolase family protein [Caenimonas terrae]|uniref:Dienelactone hydrolase family protein n=1 Tax=Caenimonas terrae TaxID=696074 RepID=A0ABW0NIR5_9BURK
MLARLLALCLLVAVWPAAAVEQVAFAAADGKLQLAGWWFPVASQVPRPAVIALHGCGGLLNAKKQLNPVWPRQAGYFNAEQMNVLVLDSFTPRGQGSICAIPNRQRTVSEEDRRDDVFAAMAWLAAQPQVDASRIAVVGWSHGAQTVLSVLDAADRAVQAQPLRPRAGVAFYPGCRKFLSMRRYALSAPLLLMVGELDDWTPAADCVALGNKLRGPGRPALDLTVYPGSYHGFDGFAAVGVREDAGNTRSGKATAGGNAAARVLSHARMFDFLAAQLEQPLRLSHEQRMKQAQPGAPPR